MKAFILDAPQGRLRQASAQSGATPEIAPGDVPNRRRQKTQILKQQSIPACAAAFPGAKTRDWCPGRRFLKAELLLAPKPFATLSLAVHIAGR